jgi:hypothetical protein
MLVRIEVHHHTEEPAYWQLTRCQVQLGGLMQDVSDAALFRPMRFDTLADSIRHAKKATFGYLEAKRHKEMPDQIDWRIYEEGRLFPCPVCQQPLYRKAKLGRFGNTLDLHDWGCSRCRKTVTLNTESFLFTRPPVPPSASPQGMPGSSVTVPRLGTEDKTVQRL